MEILKEIEKTPLSSKKFIAWAVSGFLWKAFLLCALFFGANVSVLLLTVGLVMFLDILYIGSQTALDTLVRYAAIIRGGKDV